MMRCGCLSHNGFLTVRGYAENAQRELACSEVDAMLDEQYLDKVGSVSAVDRDRDQLWLPDDLTDQQHRRFLNGW